MSDDTTNTTEEFPYPRAFMNLSNFVISLQAGRGNGPKVRKLAVAGLMLMSTSHSQLSSLAELITVYLVFRLAPVISDGFTMYMYLQYALV